jgi:hypothetical protein
VIAAEISMELLRLAPAGPAWWVRADGGCLPVRDRSADVLVSINAFLFPTEVDRVLKAHGMFVWVNTSGEETPIHLTTAEVVEALPFPVAGVEASAGQGTWCVLRRIGLSVSTKSARSAWQATEST